MSGRVANRYFGRAFRWRRRFLFMVFAFVISILLWIVLSMLGLRIVNSSLFSYGLWLLAVGAAISVIVVCYYVYVGSVSSRGWLYSAIHVGLIILLTPVCFVGVLLIPSLMNNDVLRWRDLDRQNGTKHQDQMN